ncbi:hypothetical protein N8467_01230 [bacterium]|nr:hypothetical protein [bacterium]
MGEQRSLGPDETTSIEGEDALEVLAALCRGVRVPVPGQRVRPPWQGEHFQPFVGELIHFDAVFRKARKNDTGTLLVGGQATRISVERYYYRGAGGLAHAILRSDDNTDRLKKTRAGLKRLVSDSETPLGDLFSALASKDKCQAESNELEEAPEHDAVKWHNTGSPWVNILRDGTRRIVERDLPRAKIAEALLHWIPYAIARYQVDVAFTHMKETTPAIPVDLGSSPSPLRRRSREVHDRCRAIIAKAVDDYAENKDPSLLKMRGLKSSREHARGFFSATMSAVGALNATTGKRHFVFADELLEAIILSQIDEETPFERFCEEILHDRLGLVVDKASASKCDDLKRLNQSDMGVNAGLLARKLETLGMLVRYSDATRMVRAEVIA